jgi:hypothetical protein
MTRLIIILVLSVSNLFCSCEKVKDEDTLIQIYKFKTIDYSNNVPVELSDDKNKITSAPGNISRMPVKLADDYYLGGSLGVNTGYLSFTIEEHNAFEIKPGVDSLYNLIIERNPYLEYYYRHDDGTFKNENGIYGIDTAMINTLIRADKIETQFKRLK